jgi:hypothetical protein
MRQFRIFVVAALVAVAFGQAAGTVSAQPSAPRCSTAKGSTVKLVRKTAPRSVVKVIAESPSYTGGGVTSSYCADVTGDRVPDLIVNVSAGGSIGGIAWLVYQYPTKRLVHVDYGQPNGGVEHVAARPYHGDVHESEPKYLPGDANCCPTGGRLYRQFHWQNGRLKMIRSWEASGQ